MYMCTGGSGSGGSTRGFTIRGLSLNQFSLPLFVFNARVSRPSLRTSRRNCILSCRSWKMKRFFNLCVSIYFIDILYKNIKYTNNLTEPPFFN